MSKVHVKEATVPPQPRAHERDSRKVARARNPSMPTAKVGLIQSFDVVVEDRLPVGCLVTLQSQERKAGDVALFILLR